MENKTFLGIALCILFYLGYTQYLQKKYPSPEADKTAPTSKGQKQPVDPAAVNVETSSAPQIKPTINSPSVQSASEGANQQVPVQVISLAELTFENDQVKYAFNQELSALNSVTLKKFSAEVKSRNDVELLDGPFIIQGRTVLQAKSFERGFEALRQGEKLTLTRPAFPWSVTEEFQFDKDGGYGGKIKLIFKNVSDVAQELNAILVLSEEITKPKESSMFFPDVSNRFNALVVGTDGSRTEELVHDHCKESGAEMILEGKDENIDFIGFDKHYFLKMVQPIGKKFNYSMQKLVTTNPNTCPIVIEVSQPQGQIAPGQTSELEFRTYFGPKEMHALAAVSENFTPTLNLGWFSVIAQPLLKVVKGFYKFTKNYGLAIVLLTFLLKLLFYPLTKAAAVSMKNMQKYQPELNRIREKHKDDKATQQKEIMAFMSKHKINPAKGCLPILPQIPVFIAFYNVLSQSVELRHAPFFGWINDLSAADPYYITPLLLGAGMFLQQKLTPTPSMDKTQQRIMLLMPVMFTAMMLTLPAGLVLYMITNTIVSIAQQQWLNKKLGISVASTTS